MFSQFNKVCINNIALSKLSSSKSTKGKKADISRIPSPIPPRPSKSILAKYKFYNIHHYCQTPNLILNHMLKSLREISMILLRSRKLFSNSLLAKFQKYII